MSNNRNLGNIANAITNATSGQVLTSQGSGVATFVDAGGTGVTVHNNQAAMLTDAASANEGSLHYENLNNKLYVKQSSGFFLLASITNTSPTVSGFTETTGGGSATTIADNGTFALTSGSDTVITLTATDPDLETLVYSATVTSGTASNVISSPSLPISNQSGNTFTLTPVTSGSGGTITIRFDVSDGNNVVNKTHSFSISFTPTWNQSASVMYSTWPSTIYSSNVYSGNVNGGFWFNSTGTKMILSDSEGATHAGQGRLKEYNLNPAWDHTTASFSQNGDQYIYANNGFDLTGDGLTVVYGDSSDTLKYTALTTAFDTSVRSGTRQNGPSLSMTVRDVKFSYDGSKLFVLHGTSSTNAQIWTYNLSTAYDISSSSATLDSSKTWTPNSSWNEMLWTNHFQFNPTGTVLYVVSTGYHNFTSWPLTTEWDLSTIGSHVEGGNLYVSNISRFFIRPDTGNEIYISRDNTTSGTQTIYSRRSS